MTTRRTPVAYVASSGQALHFGCGRWLPSRGLAHPTGPEVVSRIRPIGRNARALHKLLFLVLVDGTIPRPPEDGNRPLGLGSCEWFTHWLGSRDDLAFSCQSVYQGRDRTYCLLNI